MPKKEDKNKRLVNYLTKYQTKKEDLADRAHSDFLKQIVQNIDKLQIEPPYDIFYEVNLIENFNNPKKKNNSFRDSDIIVLNSELYIFEAKVITPNSRNHHYKKKVSNRIRKAKTQLVDSYSFFKEHFKEYFMKPHEKFEKKPILIGTYKKKNSSNCDYFFFNPDRNDHAFCNLSLS